MKLKDSGLMHLDDMAAILERKPFIPENTDVQVFFGGTYLKDLVYLMIRLRDEDKDITTLIKVASYVNFAFHDIMGKDDIGRYFSKDFVDSVYDLRASDEVRPHSFHL